MNIDKAKTYMNVLFQYLIDNIDEYRILKTQDIIYFFHRADNSSSTIVFTLDLKTGKLSKEIKINELDNYQMDEQEFEYVKLKIL